jgi:hypothetical protein
MKWKWLITLVVALEIATLVVQFGLPALQGWAFGDPRFPNLIVFHGSVPHSDIFDFRGNFFLSAIESTALFTSIVFGVAFAFKLARLAKTRSG